MGSLLNTLKKPFVSERQGLEGLVANDKDMDLENGIIRIDDTKSDRVVSTTDVLTENAGGDNKKIRGNGGKVFIISLLPFYETIGATPNSRMAHSLINFTETTLNRMVAGRGIFNIYANDRIFIRLNIRDAEAWAEASKIVNEIGMHFLRDAFNPEELLPEALAVVDEEDCFGDDGTFDYDKAFEARTVPKEMGANVVRIDDSPAWSQVDRKRTGKKVSVAEKWATEAVEIAAPKKTRIKRGPDRRKRAVPFEGLDRRKNPQGRRDADDPKKKVW
ncbi:MAG: hypothetical protein O3A84_04145 [Proteobacteria bacterium]|nr:hypothetical protein [Pseudomonadota bacterium]